uniref:Reverse transcriptase domain-containing protein n=1 Tax=Hordeum vulgare subsp. vulgare TaxID=112509 RepID=A0A8I6XFA5_HORVV
MPQRGLRQGDPLSLYPFLIVAEGFSSLLNKADAEASLSGTCICNGAPSLNHLVFVYDSLVLMKASCESVVHLQNVLQLYEVCTGQIVNYDKSSIMFNKNTWAV